MDIQELLTSGLDQASIAGLIAAYLCGDNAALIFTRLFGSRGKVYLWAARAAAWYLKRRSVKKQKPSFDNQLKEALTSGTFTAEGKNNEPEVSAEPVDKPVPERRPRRSK